LETQENSRVKTWLSCRHGTACVLVSQNADPRRTAAGSEPVLHRVHSSGSGDRRELIAEFRSSGLTQAAFCRQWELNPTTFSGWLRMDRQETAPVSFCEVQVPVAVSSQPIVVGLPGGAQVQIPCESAGSFAATLKEVAACWA